MVRFLSAIFQLSLLVITTYTVMNMAGVHSLGLIGYMVLFATHIFITWGTHKHSPKLYQKRLKYILAPFTKSVVAFFILTNILSIFFIDGAKEKHILFTISYVYPIVEIIIYTMLTIIITKLFDKGIRNPEQIITSYDQSDLLVQESVIPKLGDYHGMHMSNNAQYALDKFFTVVERRDGLSNMGIINEKENTEPRNDYEISVLDELVNNIKYLDIKIREVYNSLQAGGYAVFYYEELKDYENRFLVANNPLNIFKRIYYFSFQRLLRTLPGLSYFYYFVTNGKNQVLSKAEVGGRLYYAGFEIKQLEKVGNISYILARKVRTPSANPSPSFHPVIKLNRVGLHGRIIKIHKIRSMYPYSEFLQKQVYEDSNLTDTGKFDGDYRITDYGKIIRKYWLDELPQLLDWFRGEIKLVGIRAMSEHYFSLYNNDYKDSYKLVKPGIISPIFDENTDGFEDIQKIEYAYLKSYLKNPFKTDLKYFFTTIKQIIQGGRSQ